MTIPGPARRSALPLVVIAVQLVSAYLVIGLPDLSVAADFLTSTVPTTPGSIAAAQLVVWTALLAAFVATLVGVLRAAAAPAAAGRGGAAWSLAVMAAGLLIFVAGASQRAATSSVMLSGGSVQEASQLAR